MRKTNSKKKHDPSNDKRIEWVELMNDEIDFLEMDLDELEVSDGIMEAIKKAVTKFKERASQAIKDFEITPTIAFAQEDLFEDMLYAAYLPSKGSNAICSESDLDRMVDILEHERGGEFVKAESLIEQMKLEAFLAEMRTNPYQLKLIA